MKIKAMLNSLKTKLNNKAVAIAPVSALVFTGIANATEGESTTVLSPIITQQLLSGVFDEIVALLPVCIPVMVSFLAIRKGISFVRGIIQSA